MRLVFTNMSLELCCRRQAMAERWGDAAPDVELALCTLKASRDLRQFLSLPNVTEEDYEVTFNTPRSAVQLSLAEKEVDGGGKSVDVQSIVVLDEKST